MMDTWTAIRSICARHSTPGSMGRMVAINEAIDLYTLLRKNDLVLDIPESDAAMNQDEEFKPAFLERNRIKLLREGGIIR